MLQRFQMLVYPEVDRKWKNIDRKPNTEALDSAYRLFSHLSGLKVNRLGAQSHRGQLPGLHFSFEAQDIFNSWHSKLEHRLRSGEVGVPAFESHLSKYRSLVPSLALIFRLGSEDEWDKGKVGSRSIELAILWAEFLEKHAHKVYSSALRPELKAAHELAEKIKSGKVRDKDKVRTIYRKNWSLLDSSQKVDSALSVMEESHWLTTQQVKVGCTTTELIRLNPKLKF